MNIDFKSLPVKTNEPIPATARGAVGKAGGSELVDFMKSLGVYQSVTIPIEVPANVKDEERDAVFKELRKKLMNTISGAARRINKTDASYKFALRKVPLGIGLWRTDADGNAVGPGQAAPTTEPKGKKAA